ncbi:hypothetical protein ACDF64_07035 [Agromyces sp. MMS24-JH15]
MSESARATLDGTRDIQEFTDWKRGEAAFDHHAPIDPSDPD